MTAYSVTESQRGAPLGNVLSRNIFSGEHFKAFTDFYGEGAQVAWDVSVPVLSGGRPVVDHEIIAAGRTSKMRLDLGVAADQDGIVVSIDNLHRSRHHTERLPLALPVIGDASSDLFSEQVEPNLYDTLVFGLGRAGDVAINGFKDGEWESVFSTSSPHTNGYVEALNVISRMLSVPFREGISAPRPVDVPYPDLGQLALRG